jgi:hypothetical protein
MSPLTQPSINVTHRVQNAVTPQVKRILRKSALSNSHELSKGMTLNLGIVRFQKVVAKIRKVPVECLQLGVSSVAVVVETMSTALRCCSSIRFEFVSAQASDIQTATDSTRPRIMLPAGRTIAQSHNLGYTLLHVVFWSLNSRN